MKYNVSCTSTICQSESAVSIVVQIIARLLQTLAAIYAVGKFLWGMFTSQQNRIKKALKGTKGNVADKLGFMDKVKTEVITLFYLYRAINYILPSANRKIFIPLI